MLQPAASIHWTMYRASDVAQCRTTLGADAMLTIDIDAPDLCVVVTQHCRTAVLARAAASAWRTSFAQDGWIDRPPPVTLRLKADRRRAQTAAVLDLS